MDAHGKNAVAEPPDIDTERTPNWGEGVQIDACPSLARFVVKTRNSAYDVVVVDGRRGDILVRGGRLFPEFRQAQLVGATAGGHTVKLLGLYVGLCMEFYADRRSVITSPVLEISRPTSAATRRDDH